MKFDDIRQCGMRCKELGPMTSISIPPTASYKEIIEKAKQQFFAATACCDDEGRYEYFLADPQGSKLIDQLIGSHGIWQSKSIYMDYILLRQRYIVCRLVTYTVNATCYTFYY